LAAATTAGSRGVAHETLHAVDDAAEGRTLPVELLGVALDGELRALAFGDVHLEPDVVCHLAAVVADRGDVDAVPELLAVPAVVQQFDGDRDALVDGLGHLPDRVGVGLLALQEPAVRPQRLLAVVAGHLLEGVVDVDERVVRQVGVAHRHADGRLLEDAPFQFGGHVAVDVDAVGHLAEAAVGSGPLGRRSTVPRRLPGQQSPHAVAQPVDVGLAARDVGVDASVDRPAGEVLVAVDAGEKDDRGPRRRIGDTADELQAVERGRLVVDDDAVDRLDRPHVASVRLRDRDRRVARPQRREDRPGSPAVRRDEEHTARHVIRVDVVPNNPGETGRLASVHGTSWSPSSS
jgi:hypothetical protein